MSSVLEAAPPRFTAGEAARLAAEVFSVRGSASDLGSERDQAFLLDDGGAGGVLKISNGGEDEAALDLEEAAIAHVTAIAPDLPVARPLAYRIQEHLMTLPNAANRGVKTANFRVLRKAEYPAVLVECGFLSNRKEGAAARSARRRDDLADKMRRRSWTSVTARELTARLRPPPILLRPRPSMGSNLSF